MRFEIRAGGAFAILLGLGLLSGAVFLLGLVAGYEMGRQQESSQQFATVYPLPSPPAAEPTPAPGLGDAMAGSTSVPAPAAPPTVPAPEALAPVANSSPEVAAAALTPAPPPEPVAIATAAPAAPLAAATPGERPRVTKAVASAEESSLGANAEPEITSPAPSVRRKGYSVQIEAAMDRAGAHQMVAKLGHLGYQSYIVETLIGGQTWYRVRVGPYATQEEARAAEAKLHEQYTGAFTTR